MFVTSWEKLQFYIKEPQHAGVVSCIKKRVMFTSQSAPIGFSTTSQKAWKTHADPAHCNEYSLEKIFKEFLKLVNILKENISVVKWYCAFLSILKREISVKYQKKAPFAWMSIYPYLWEMYKEKIFYWSTLLYFINKQMWSLTLKKHWDRF